MSAHDLDLTPRPSEARRAHWTYERRASDPVVLPMRRSRRGAVLAAVLGIGVGLGIVALWGTQIDGPEPMLSDTAPFDGRSPDYSTTHYEQVLSHRALTEARMTLGSSTMNEQAVALSDGSSDLTEDAIHPHDAIPTSGVDSSPMSTGYSGEPTRPDVPMSDVSGTQQSSGVEPATRARAASDSAPDAPTPPDNPYSTGRGQNGSGSSDRTQGSDNPY